MRSVEAQIVPSSCPLKCETATETINNSCALLENTIYVCGQDVPEIRNMKREQPLSTNDKNPCLTNDPIALLDTCDTSMLCSYLKDKIEKSDRSGCVEDGEKLTLDPHKPTCRVIKKGRYVFITVTPVQTDPCEPNYFVILSGPKDDEKTKEAACKKKEGRTQNDIPKKQRELLSTETMRSRDLLNVITKERRGDEESYSGQNSNSKKETKPSKYVQCTSSVEVIPTELEEDIEDSESTACGFDVCTNSSKDERSVACSTKSVLAATVLENEYCGVVTCTDLLKKDLNGTCPAKAEDAATALENKECGLNTSFNQLNECVKIKCSTKAVEVAPDLENRSCGQDSCTYVPKKDVDATCFESQKTGAIESSSCLYQKPLDKMGLYRRKVIINAKCGTDKCCCKSDKKNENLGIEETYAKVTDAMCGPDTRTLNKIQEEKDLICTETICTATQPEDLELFGRNLIDGGVCTQENQTEFSNSKVVDESVVKTTEIEEYSIIYMKKYKTEDNKCNDVCAIGETSKEVGTEEKTSICKAETNLWENIFKVNVHLPYSTCENNINSIPNKTGNELCNLPQSSAEKKTPKSEECMGTVCTTRKIDCEINKTPEEHRKTISICKTKTCTNLCENIFEENVDTPDLTCAKIIKSCSEKTDKDKCNIPQSFTDKHTPKAEECKDTACIIRNIDSAKKQQQIAQGKINKNLSKLPQPSTEKSPKAEECKDETCTTKRIDSAENQQIAQDKIANNCIDICPKINFKHEKDVRVPDKENRVENIHNLKKNTAILSPTEIFAFEQAVNRFYKIRQSGPDDE